MAVRTALMFMMTFVIAPIEKNMPENMKTDAAHLMTSVQATYGGKSL